METETPGAGGSRRSFLKGSLAATAPALLAGGLLPVEGAEAGAERSGRLLKVVCVGAHPDDPESGASGTLARYAERGHSTAVIYLTRGERGISGKTDQEAAAIRTAECEAACKVIGARPLFAGQVDGSAEFTRARVEEMGKLLGAEAPDVLFIHWPIDTHFDHQAASLCALRAAMALKARPEIYFFEVNTGSQTWGFSPGVYVEISGVVEKKRQALLAHQSQDGEGIWRSHHQPVAQFRGREAGVAAAEAFVRLNRESRESRLPGA